MSSTKFADYLIEKVPINFSAPFVDNTLLCLFDKYALGNFDNSVNNAWDKHVCDYGYEDAVDNLVDTFFSELFFLTKKMPTSVALLEMAENEERKFCGVANEVVSKMIKRHS